MKLPCEHPAMELLTPPPPFTLPSKFKAEDGDDRRGGGHRGGGRDRGGRDRGRGPRRH
jgi:hypothetical protein